MDSTTWLLQLAGDELEHIEDSLRSGEFSEMIEQQVTTGIVPFPCSRCTYPTTGRCQQCGVPLCFLCQNGGKDGKMVCLECHVKYIRESEV